MAVQIVNGYGYCVKRVSVMAGSGPQSGQYEGEQVFVVAASPANAMAVLQAQYGADLGPVTGGGTWLPSAITTMTGS